ncbi:MAG: hypothetical protein GTO02_13175 [Candidatus Dadabacteria bacterium]|nr:hypothetical protein [Candidatus Dadabacteria bacterium]NIQ15299.1 hypothetical protein [Candidatus Dadabacteria bacterium]
MPAKMLIAIISEVNPSTGIPYMNFLKRKNIAIKKPDKANIKPKPDAT